MPNLEHIHGRNGHSPSNGAVTSSRAPVAMAGSGQSLNEGGLDDIARRRALRDRAGIVGSSKRIQSVMDLVDQVSWGDTTVLISGESGVGKELVAKAIHTNSERADLPFVRISCDACPEAMMESELFGVEPGVMPGVPDGRDGRFQLAAGGTIFIDEIADFSLSTQGKLLRALQERHFEKVGGSDVIPTDVRVIASTNRDLEQLIAQGRFREDLYYRLNVFPIVVPPLRERKSDIVLLADHFIEKYNQHHGRDVRRISTPAIDMLVSYHWPGNVREMENCFERAVLICQEGVIQSHNLPPSLQTADQSQTVQKGSLQEMLDRVEYELIMEALKTNRGNMARAARELKVSERIMGLRVKKYQIDCSRF